MAPKGKVTAATSKKAGKGGQNGAPLNSKVTVASQASASVKWPKVGWKELVLEETEEDQILIIDNFFHRSEIQSFLSMFATLPLQPTPPAKKGEAHRTNSRFSVQDPKFARTLWKETGLEAAWEREGGAQRWKACEAKGPAKGEEKTVGLSENIRIYKYEPGQLFNPHYDDTVRHPSTLTHSEWTLLIYLTGVEDGVEGGETVFSPEADGKTGAKGQRPPPIVTPLRRGRALLHRHGQACMLHEGRAPVKGTKWVLRSDVMFGRE